MSELEPAILDELAQIAADIHRREANFVEATKHWLVTGRDIARAKSVLHHGGLKPWCEQHLPYDIRTARRFMRAAEIFDLGAKTDTVSVLPEMTLVLAIARHTKDEGERRGMILRAGSGNPKDIAAVKEAVKAPRPEHAQRPDRSLSPHASDPVEPKPVNRVGPEGEQIAHDARFDAHALLTTFLEGHLIELLNICDRAEAGEVLNERLRRQIARTLHSRTVNIFVERPDRLMGGGERVRGVEPDAPENIAPPNPSQVN